MTSRTLNILIVISIVVLTGASIVLGIYGYPLVKKHIALSHIPPKTQAEKTLLALAASPTKTLAVANKYLDLSVQNAKKSDTLEITGCIATPTVIEAPINSTIKVINNDSEEHVLIINKFFLPIKAHTTVDQKLDFKNPALFTLRCDRSDAPIGELVLIDNRTYETGPQKFQNQK